MKIKSITLSYQNNNIFENNKKSVIFNSLEEKKINIFFMPNTSGKSLIFNSLKHLFSFDKNKFIKKTNKDLIITIEFDLNEKEYIFESNYNDNYKIILHNGEKIKNFDEILKQKLGIEGESLKYNGGERNSLASLNRFNFLDFSTIWDKEDSNKINFIDSRKDGYSRKIILAYILGADINGGIFDLIIDYEYKKDFVEKNKKKFEKYISEEKIEKEEQLQLEIGKTEDLFKNLENYRIIFGDISIAIKKLQELKEELIIEFGTSEREDLNFLENEIQKLLGEKENIKNEIKKIKEEIQNNVFLEKADSQLPLLKGEDIQKFRNYKKFLKDLETNFNELEIQNLLQEKIEPSIQKFKDFLQKIYEIFIKKAIEKNIILNLQFEKDNIIFNERNLSIEAFFETSESTRKTLRVLSFIGLHIYAQKNNTKCLKYSFYDSFIENIDDLHRELLFETLFDFIEQENIDLPNMFFFITKIEKEEKSILDLKSKYEKYINLIESNGLRSNKTHKVK